ncbi:MAG: hypothetical protein K0R85_2396 [Devosia sp.]|nr:hypothetical protein [Devosia sp.]
MRDALRLVMFAVIIFGVTTMSVLFSDPGFAANITERLGLSDGRAASIELAQAAPSDARSFGRRRGSGAYPTRPARHLDGAGGFPLPG